MVDVHLKEPTEKLPDGVQIGIKHFLDVPSCPEVREAWEGDNHEHHFLKVTKTKKGLNIKIIDTFKDVTSNYFMTEKLENQSLCQLAVGFRFPFIDKGFPFIDKRKPTCSHNSPKSFVLTQAKGRCPHREHSLFLWCVCHAVKPKTFDKEIAEDNHEKSCFRKKLNEMSTASHTSYEVSLKLSEGGEWDTRKTSHLEMCKNNGIMMLGEGTIKQRVVCACDSSGNHCCDGKNIFLKIEKIEKGTKSCIGKHDSLLECRNDCKKEQQGLSNPTTPTLHNKTTIDFTINNGEYASSGHTIQGDNAVGENVSMRNTRRGQPGRQSTMSQYHSCENLL